MTQEQLAGYVGLLHAMRDEFSGRHSCTEALVIEPVPDSMDQLVFASERDLAVDSINRQAQALNQINRALHRIRAGEFGVCLHCNQPISLKRLTALPWAALCIRCQEAEDRAEGVQQDLAEFSSAV